MKKTASKGKGPKFGSPAWFQKYPKAAKVAKRGKATKKR